MANNKELYEPEDNKRFRELYEKTGRGVCGISVIAVLEKTTLNNLVEKFMLIDGFMTLKNMRRVLEKLDYKTKLYRGNKAKKFPYYKNKKHICRVQWIGKEEGKFHSYTSWYEATRNTHWILIKGDMFYCNLGGWAELRWLPEYLEEGYITSYLELIKKQNGK